MLCALHIENIAVIEHADITFHRGFNVLSGETGAGKSIIIDAISAILGERTYREVIRTGAEKAFVSAVFSDVPAFDWFSENHVPYEDELMIQRELWLDGKNICRVNGQSISVSVLRQLGQQLISIHGQHDSQQLFDEDRHLFFLDCFADNADSLADYRTAFGTVRELRAELDRLNIDDSEKLRRQETLEYQIKELEKADLKPGEDTELEERLKLLMNAEKLVSGLNAAIDSLYGDESVSGAIDGLYDVKQSLDSVGRVDGQGAAFAARVQELIYSAQDIAEELKDYRDGFSYSDEETERIGARLDLIHRLRRKYGATCEDMLAYLANAREELDEIAFSDERKLQIEKRLAAATAVAQEKAEKLHDIRVAAAKDLEQKICSELAELNMPKVQFSCEFAEVPLSNEGTDGVRFLMSANLGEALKPLSKVASGGELARIMLALKNVMASHDAVQTMIFDEVDAGVSGRAAQKVAEKLLSVSKGRQVLCVTHLPQIAAMAEHHLLISKSDRNGRTYTQVDVLDLEGRTTELARMIGGAEITNTTLLSAREMLHDIT